MLSALASADAVQWASIFVEALANAATLVAAGSALVLATLRGLDDGDRNALRRLGFGSAILAAISSVLRIPTRASFLAGSTFDGATDPMLLGMVSDSPLGTSIAIRLVGLGLILALAVPHRPGLWVATAGAVLACASFAFRGHALEEPRLLLGLLLTLHILGLAFWIGGFAPLLRQARLASPVQTGEMANEFGQKALWVVGGLAVAGAMTLGVLTDLRIAALLSPYGQFFAVKLAVFAAVIGMAALNRFQLTPALRRGDARAADRLTLSIRVEAALIALILLTTATLTTLTSPPRVEVVGSASAKNSGEIAPVTGPPSPAIGLRPQSVKSDHGALFATHEGHSG